MFSSRKDAYCRSDRSENGFQFLRQVSGVLRVLYLVDPCYGKSIPVGGCRFITGMEMAHIAKQAGKRDQILKTARGQGTRRLSAHHHSAQILERYIVQPCLTLVQQKQSDVDDYCIFIDITDDFVILPLA